jgi:diguanylate cyclase (GGDEF)-like protein/PAS domain S-box-containing protein
MSAPENGCPTGKKTVLVMDDSVVVLEMLAAVLGGNGFQVCTAKTLEQLQRLRASCRPDLYVLDVEMPEVPGDAVGRLLRDEQREQVPILLFSNIEERELARRAADADLTGYVSKGAGVPALLARIVELLGEPPARVDSNGGPPPVRAPVAMPAAIDGLETWSLAPTLLDAVLERLATGVILLDGTGRILFANESMAILVGIRARELVGSSADALMDRMLAIVPDPPRLVKERRLFPQDRRAVCEEFEIAEPGRSIVRWAALPIEDRVVRQLVLCEDITAEVDLARMHERLAFTDALTGLDNRRGAEHAFEREMQRAWRAGSAISIALFDIDNFKALNDRHGHSAGDVALRLVASTLQSAARGSDLVARWGGEEFLVGLPDTSLDGASLCAERIRVAVAALSTNYGPITVSGGLAQVLPNESLAEAVARADAHLYAAKTSGRNRLRG